MRVIVGQPQLQKLVLTEASSFGVLCWAQHRIKDRTGVDHDLVEDHDLGLSAITPAKDEFQIWGHECCRDVDGSVADAETRLELRWERSAGREKQGERDRGDVKFEVVQRSLELRMFVTNLLVKDNRREQRLPAASRLAKCRRISSHLDWQ